MVDFLSGISSILGKISRATAFGFFVASAYFVFCPSGVVLVGENYRWLPILALLFSSGWLVVEVTGAVKRWRMHGRRVRRRDRMNLYSDIHHLQQRFRGLRGMLSDQGAHYEAASLIADKYSRLRKMGIQTPSIDLVAAEWDFRFHNEYLTRVNSMLLKSDLGDIKRETKRFLMQ